MTITLKCDLRMQLTFAGSHPSAQRTSKEVARCAPSVSKEITERNTTAWLRSITPPRWEQRIQQVMAAREISNQVAAAVTAAQLGFPRAQLKP